jgi:hypothetical protein
VLATTTIEGNTYTSISITATGSAGFIAKSPAACTPSYLPVRQAGNPAARTRSAGIPDDDHQPGHFHHQPSGRHLQTIAVNDASKIVTLSLVGTYSMCAIINAVTTEKMQIDDADAVTTVVEDTSDLVRVVYMLVIG